MLNVTEINNIDVIIIMFLFSQLDIATSFKNITTILQKWLENDTHFSQDVILEKQRYFKEVTRFV